ncbi:hypothetical protein GQ457_07G003840 [Hibiscus cannabinus]
MLVVSMCGRMELSGVPHNVYSFNILINCFCQLGQIDFGFLVLGMVLKLGVEPVIVTLSILINGFCNARDLGPDVTGVNPGNRVNEFRKFEDYVVKIGN